MTKHLRVWGVLFSFLFVCVPRLSADTYSPTYLFNGVITATGTNPTCGTSPGPCVETIDVSFEYYYAFLYAQGEVAAVDLDLLPGSIVSAMGELGSLLEYGVQEFYYNEPDFYYSEILLEGGEIDLNLDPETNAFSADTYSCQAECENLFGGGGTVGGVPTTLEYTLSQLPEPSTLVSVLLGILCLAIPQLRRRTIPC
jgi:hypothetical protein